MRSSIPFVAAALGLMVGCCLVSSASAQPPLSSLWPNEDGKRWEYQYTDVLAGQSDYASLATLQLDGTVMTAGGTAQILVGTGAHRTSPPGEPAGLSPLYRAVWRARPDLRRAIELQQAKWQSAASWNPLLIHDGYFMKGLESIQMWQPEWDHPTWTYLTSALSVGAEFTHQLVPELADDIFLHGTVSSIDDAVTTPAGNFTGAVRMTYVIDYGISEVVNESAELLARVHSETNGTVHFVPGIGPVDVHEVYTGLASVECLVVDCSFLSDLFPDETQDLALTSYPTPAEARSWGEVKTLYR